MAPSLYKHTRESMTEEPSTFPLEYNQRLSAYARVTPMLTQVGHYLMRIEKGLTEGTTLQGLVTSGQLKAPHLIGSVLDSNGQPYRHYDPHYLNRSKPYSATMYHLPYQWQTEHLERWLPLNDDLMEFQLGNW